MAIDWNSIQTRGVDPRGAYISREIHKLTYGMAYANSVLAGLNISKDLPDTGDVQIDGGVCIVDHVLISFTDDMTFNLEDLRDPFDEDVIYYLVVYYKYELLPNPPVAEIRAITEEEFDDRYMLPIGAIGKEAGTGKVKAASILWTADTCISKRYLEESYLPKSNWEGIEGVYVSFEGDDDVGNGTYDNPYLTIQKAIDSCPRFLEKFCEYHVIIKDGIYTNTENGGTIHVSDKHGAGKLIIRAETAPIVSAPLAEDGEYCDYFSTTINSATDNPTIEIRNCDAQIEIKDIQFRNATGAQTIDDYSQIRVTNSQFVNIYRCDFIHENFYTGRNSVIRAQLNSNVYLDIARFTADIPYWTVAIDNSMINLHNAKLAKNTTIYPSYFTYTGTGSFTSINGFQNTASETTSGYYNMYESGGKVNIDNISYIKPNSFYTWSFNNDDYLMRYNPSMRDGRNGLQMNRPMYWEGSLSETYLENIAYPTAGNMEYLTLTLGSDYTNNYFRIRGADGSSNPADLGSYFNLIDLGWNSTFYGTTFFKVNIDVLSDANIHNNLVVDVDGSIGHDLGVGNNANISNNLTVGNNGSIANDLDVGNDLTVGNDVAVTRDVSVGNNLSVTNDVDVSGMTNTSGIHNNISETNEAITGIWYEYGSDNMINKMLWSDFKSKLNGEITTITEGSDIIDFLYYENTAANTSAGENIMYKISWDNFLDQWYEDISASAVSLVFDGDPAEDDFIFFQDTSEDNRMSKMSLTNFFNELNNKFYYKSELDADGGNVGAKADKVDSAVEDNLASLSSTGNLKDSGLSVVKIASGDTDEVWTASKIDEEIGQNLETNYYNKTEIEQMDSSPYFKAFTLTSEQIATISIPQHVQDVWSYYYIIIDAQVGSSSGPSQGGIGKVDYSTDGGTTWNGYVNIGQISTSNQESVSGNFGGRLVRRFAGSAMTEFQFRVQSIWEADINNATITIMKDRFV